MRLRRALLERTTLWITLATCTAVFLVPILWTVSASLKTDLEAFSVPPTLLPRAPTLNNYRLVLHGPFYHALENSVIIGIASTFITVALASPAAYAFSRYPYPGAQRIFFGLLFIRMLPSVALIVPYFLAMRGLHLVDTRMGIAIAYLSFQLPYAVWFMKGFFDGIPRDLEEAARIDGCTRLAAYTRVVLPLAAAGLSALAVFVFFLSWNELLFALVLSRSLGSKTTPVLIAEGISEFQIKWGEMSASSVLFLIPGIVFYTLVLRYMLRGLTAGAVKG